MHRRRFLAALPAMSVLVAGAAEVAAPDAAHAQAPDAPAPIGQDRIDLPPANRTGGPSLLEALAKRRSQRGFSKEPLGLRTLSNLFWAACGVNREGEGKRTAPTARNKQEILVYAAFEKGLYLYDHEAHALVKQSGEDLRALTGKQDFVADAPLNLLFVADFARMAAGDDQVLYSSADAGFVSQNVYLFCAAYDLATVVRGWLDREALAKAMRLAKDQRIVLAQTVGRPA